MNTLPDIDTLRRQLATLEHGLLERSEAVRLLLLAALAGEHVLLIGPPGTAKSELARRLHRCIAGTRYFERLLTRFSTPEELFGPLSLKALEDDRYERLIDGYLPTAGIAFLDEVFKANSAILNALLTLLNEREFDNGAGRQPTPLVTLVGATNEAPADDSLLAFHDRFLLRVPVAPVGDASFGALLRLDGEPPAAPAPPLSAAAGEAVRRAGAAVALGDDALQALQALRQQARALALTVSDRRWRQLVGLLRTAVAAEGRREVDALDLWLVPYVVAPDAETAVPLHAWVDAALAQAAPEPWSAFDTAVQAFEAQLQVEQQAPADSAHHPDADAGKLALARAAGGRTADGEPLRMVSERQQQKLARRWSPVHVAARVAQIDEALAQMAAALHEMQQRHDRLRQRCHDRLWLPPARADAWLATQARAVDALQALLQRLAACRAGFAALPQDAGAPPRAPEPVAVAK